MTHVDANTIPLLVEASKMMLSSEHPYPNFLSWFWNKVVPGVWLGTDKVLLTTLNGNFIGVAIIKNNPIEKKLRAVRVVDKYQNKGYGLAIIDNALKELGTDKPLCSVSETELHNYSRIFINRYHFDMTFVHNNLYFKNTLEYQFNGRRDSLNVKTIVF